MNSIIIYIIEVLMASTVLGSFYFLLFRNSTFFRFNRYYLLSSIVLPLVFPLIPLPVASSSALPNVFVLLDEVNIGVQPVVAASHSSTLPLLQYVYLGVSILLLLRMMIGIMAIFSLFSKAKKQRLDNDFLYVSTQKVNPFSVFKRIMVSEDTFQEESSLHRILIHEKTHIKQHHGLDVFVTEIICALFWFNPMLWVLKKELKSTHEYLADEKVLEHDFDLAEYFMLMFDNIVGRNVGLANNFNQSLNLKRMKMMKKKRSSRFVKAMSMAVLPVIMGATLMLTSQCTSSQEETEVESVQTITKSATVDTDEKVFMVVEKMPKYPGGESALMKYLSKNVVYPALAQENGIQGRVYVQFVINKTGEVVNVEILKGVDAVLDAEAIRVVKAMPNWEPGQQRGKIVSVSYRLPINFTLR